MKARELVITDGVSFISSEILQRTATREVEAELGDEMGDRQKETVWKRLAKQGRAWARYSLISTYLPILAALFASCWSRLTVVKSQPSRGLRSCVHERPAILIQNVY